MRFSTFVYALKQGLKNIYRNRTFSLASVGTITACLFLFGTFYCLVGNIQSTVNKVEKSVAVAVYFNEDTDEQTILDLEKVIALREEVASVKYVSDEQAWEDFKNDKFQGDDANILDGLGEENPLAGSANLQIYLNDTGKQAELKAYLETFPQVRKINSSDELASAFTSFNRVVGITSFAIIIILVAVAIFLISNTVTIGITVRKEEIAIMKYIGATDFFVRGPFLVEGILIGLIGSGIPMIILRLLYNKIIQYVTTEFGNLANVFEFVPTGEIFKWLVPISLAIGLGIGFIGSYGTLRKHVRV